LTTVVSWFHEAITRHSKLERLQTRHGEIPQANEKTGQPIVLTVNGKAAAVVHDPDSYQDYLREKERQETIAEFSED
jgi:hypothetical protein